MALLPWLLLTLALVVPGNSFLCNLIAVAVGDIYARGWCSVCQLSEARAVLLDRKLPFRLWRRLGGSLYVPASAEERRAALQTPIKPIPGSYPVQAYAPLSSLPSPHTPEMHSQSFEGWRNSPCSHGHGHSHGHSAAHHMPSPSAWGVPAGHTHSAPPALFPGYPASCPLSTISPGGRPPGGSNAGVPEVTVPVGSAAVAQQGPAVWSPAGPVVR
uniref:Rhomboid domain containing 2 n=1 Tax=Lepisosteus oculatus TaxID=7918 RepID=W5M0G5_LEPOC|nr:PREDICTED: rhomboid domain-containing protein 2 [Lepisosteus oculatus]